MRKLAITGGIAEGKSTVLGYLRDLGYAVGSSDEIARAVLLTEVVQDGLRQILSMEGPVTPEDLRARIWADSSLRRSVNRLMHPEILRSIESSEAQVLEVPLLIEACLQGRFDRVWVVTCGPEEQRRRLLERAGSERTVDDILSTQLPSEMKAAFADVIVRTNRPPRDVQRFVAAMAPRTLD